MDLFYKLEFSNKKFILNDEVTIKNVSIDDLGKYKDLKILIINGSFCDKCIGKINASNLEELYLHNTNLTDNCFKEIAKFKKLKVLSVKDNEEITGTGLVYLNELNLEFIDLSSTSFNSTGVVLVAQMKNLTLSFDNTRVTYSDLHKLSFNNTIKIKSDYFDRQVDDFIYKQIENNLNKKPVEEYVFNDVKNAMHKFFSIMNTWAHFQYKYDLSKNSIEYLDDVLSEYSFGLENARYIDQPNYMFDKYVDIKFVEVEKIDDENVVVYIQDLKKNHCFKRFHLLGDQYKVTKVELLDFGWKEIKV